MEPVPQITVRSYKVAHCSVVVASGEIDAAAAPLLRNELARADSPRIVLELTDVSFLDSTGLGVLVEAMQNVRAEGGWVRLVGASAPVVKLLKITRLDVVFSIHDTVDSAVSSPEETMPDYPDNSQV